MAVRTYDPSKEVITFGGVPLSGFADGTFIRASRSGDAFSKHSGADGVTSRSKSSDKSGEVVITLAQTSPSNDYLSAIAALDENSGLGVLPLASKDLSGRTTIFADNAWIRKVTDKEGAKEITNREWVIDCANLKMFVGGNGDL